MVLGGDARLPTYTCRAKGTALLYWAAMPGVHRYLVCWSSTGLLTQLAVLLAGCSGWEGCRWRAKMQPSRDSAI